MPVNLKGRSYLTLMDFTQQEIRYLLDLGHDLKRKKRSGIPGDCLRGKNIVLLFEKTSTRTRCAFEVAVHDEGGHVTFLEPGSSQMGKKESMEDTAKVLGRFFDGIEYRGFDQRIVEELAKHSGVPVYNGLTDDDHPTQIIADFMTMEEHIAKPLSRQKLVFVGDGINDAPVLSRADVGVAMGAMGSDAAIEAADIVLMDDDLTKLSEAVTIARKTLRIVRQNVVFALGVKFLVLALSAVGRANMWMAVFADVGVSIIAILNAGRMLRVK